MTAGRSLRDLTPVLVTALVLLLSACATVDTAAPLTLAPRTLSDSFLLEGRVSASDGQQAASGRLEWEHSPEGDIWSLFSPMGQMVAELVASPLGAQLRTADGQHHHAPSAEDMLPALLGIPAPLDGLTHWVQAVPRTGARVLAADGNGRPLRISDAGWIIDYPEYRDDSAQALPRRIDARWGEARIRLLIDQWTTPP